MLFFSVYYFRSNTLVKNIEIKNIKSKVNKQMKLKFSEKALSNEPIESSSKKKSVNIIY
jgi:hypothetical protein